MSPEIFRLLNDLRAAGLTVAPGASGLVRVSPLDRLTPQRRTQITTSKEAILAALDLEARIRAMATRWHYSDADLADAMTRARKDPAEWMLTVSLDEQSERAFRDAGFLPKAGA